MERGWSSVLAGAMVFGAGSIVLAIAALMHRIEELFGELHRAPQREAETASEVPSARALPQVQRPADRVLAQQSFDTALAEAEAAEKAPEASPEARPQGRPAFAPPPPPPGMDASPSSRKRLLQELPRLNPHFRSTTRPVPKVQRTNLPSQPPSGLSCASLEAGLWKTGRRNCHRTSRPRQFRRHFQSCHRRAFPRCRVYRCRPSLLSPSVRPGQSRQLASSPTRKPAELTWKVQLKRPSRRRRRPGLSPPHRLPISPFPTCRRGRSCRRISGEFLRQPPACPPQRLPRLPRPRLSPPLPPPLRLRPCRNLLRRPQRIMLCR